MASTLTDIVLSPFRTMGKAGRLLAFVGMLNGCSAFFPDFKIAPADGGVDQTEESDGGYESSDVYDDGADVYDGGHDVRDVVNDVHVDVRDGGMDVRDSGADIYDGGDAADGGCIGDPPVTACGLNRRGRLEYLCRDGEYVPLRCNDSDVCIDGTMMSVACGLNDRGMQSNACVEGHYTSGSCIDPDVCVDGSVDVTACGLNNRGSHSRDCVAGHYTAFSSCVDPDECRDGTRRDVTCGFNSRGRQEQGCIEGHYRALGSCVDPDECVDGIMEMIACGLNNRGRQDRDCVVGHYVVGSCADPDECVDGTIDRLACGINNRGAQSRTCVVGHYDAFGSCVDPDECVDGVRESVACGFNDRGSQNRECVDGHYRLDSCADPDECVDGSIEMMACGLNGRGSQSRDCVDGHYGMFDPCVDPDECVNGARDRVSCGVDVGVCFVGLESRVCALDGMGNFVWQRQGDCDGRLPPAPGARGFREDMNGDAVCSAADLNGLDDDCNGIVDDGLCMVVVAEGFFYMGCDPMARPDCRGSIDLGHNIALSRYSIDKHEVTNRQYAACVAAGGCTPPSAVNSFSRPSYYDNPTFATYPVIWVTHGQTEAYCAAAGKRLPTEAEWEKAARGTDRRTYPWGESAPTCELANFGFRACYGDTTEVGSLPTGASPYGALDMAGNVVEWVHDWYDSSYYGMSPPSDPQGPAMGTQRVNRGGYFVNNATFITTYVRFSLDPALSQVALGFRCTKSER